MGKIKIKQIVTLAMLTAISSVLMMLSFPMPFLPPFLKLDLSGVPILIAAFMFGPWQGVVVAFLKNCVNLMATTSGGVGELSDFLIMASFAIIAGYLYKHYRTKKSAVWGCVLGTIVVTVVGALTNKLLIIPAYTLIMPVDEIIKVCAAVNPMIDGIDAYIIFGAVPFNMIKGVILSLVTIMVYKKLSSFINKDSIVKK